MIQQKNLIVMLVMLLFLGCAAKGPKYAAIQSTISPVSSSHSRIFFYRPTTTIFSLADAKIDLNGEVIAECENGAFLWHDIPAGHQIITVAAEDSSADRGVWNFSLDTEPGQEYYAMIQPRRGAKNAALLGGFLLMAAEAATADDGKTGLFQVELTDKATAMNEIVQLSFKKGID